MRNGIFLAALALTGCVSGHIERPDYYSSNGSLNDPKPFCTSGPNGQTAACVGAMIQTAVFDKITK